MFYRDSWLLPGHLTGTALAFICLGMIVTEARSETKTSLEQIVSDVREVEADDILEQLVNMIDDQRYSASRCNNLVLVVSSCHSGNINAFLFCL